MKTNILVAISMAALLTAGCAQNEITDMSPDANPAVGFSVYATPQTRGTVTDNTSIQSTSGVGFGVIAYYTDQNTWSTSTSYLPNFMWNQQVKYSSGWGYTPVKYWPNTGGDKISFFAYAPYSETQTSTGDFGIIVPSKTVAAKPTLTFTLQANPISMVDLVATKKMNQVKQTTAIAFQFQHLLTRLNFLAKQDVSLSGTPTHIFVTGLRVLGTATNGSAGDASGANSSSLFYTKATYDWNSEVWDYTLAKTASSVPYDLVTSSAANGIINLTTPSSSTYAGYVTPSVHLDQSATATSLCKTNQYLFLIPPKDNASNGGITSANDVRMQIDYDIVTIDSKLNQGYSKTSTQTTVSLPNKTLARGKAYDFTFTIGLEKVQVSATVATWDTTGGDVAVPSADATDATAATINTAIATLNTAKGSAPNCNYFVVNVTGAGPGSSTALTAISSNNFVSGDKIEIACTSSFAGTYTLAGWATSKSGNSVILTKN